MKRVVLGLAIAMSTASTTEARSESEGAAAWLTDLQQAIAGDLADDRPLVVQVHVPLCDNNIIRCGKGGLGDGESAGRNLYWATSGGFVGWFGRRGSTWKQVHQASSPSGSDVLEVRVWKRRFRTPPELAPRGERRGKNKTFDAYVVAYAWRGAAIRKAMDAYVGDLLGGDPRVIKLDDGTEIRAGGEAQVVSYVGHNGWMDVANYDFKAIADAASTPSKRRKGTIAVACITEDYLAADLSSKRTVPLLFTRWLLFAGAHSFEGAVSALARGEDLAGIRRAAIASYAEGQGKKASRVSGAFTNPSDKRWKNL